MGTRRWAGSARPLHSRTWNHYVAILQRFVDRSWEIHRGYTQSRASVWRDFFRRIQCMHCMQARFLHSYYDYPPLHEPELIIRLSSAASGSATGRKCWSPQIRARSAMWDCVVLGHTLARKTLPLDSVQVSFVAFLALARGRTGKGSGRASALVTPLTEPSIKLAELTWFLLTFGARLLENYHFQRLHMSYDMTIHVYMRTRRNWILNNNCSLVASSQKADMKREHEEQASAPPPALVFAEQRNGVRDRDANTSP